MKDYIRDGRYALYESDNSTETKYVLECGRNIVIGFDSVEETEGRDLKLYAGEQYTGYVRGEGPEKIVSMLRTLADIT